MLDIDALSSLYGDAISVKDGKIRVVDAGVLASGKTDELAQAAVFGAGAEREYARWLLWELGQAVGIHPASIHALYIARGKGLVHGFTVPAINVRGAAYDT